MTDEKGPETVETKTPERSQLSHPQLRRLWNYIAENEAFCIAQPDAVIAAAAANVLGFTVTTANIKSGMATLEIVRKPKPPTGEAALRAIVDEQAGILNSLAGLVAELESDLAKHAADNVRLMRCSANLIRVVDIVIDTVADAAGRPEIAHVIRNDPAHAELMECVRVQLTPAQPALELPG